MKTLQFGDYVQTSRHNFRGRIYGIKRLDLTDQKIKDWLNEQSIPVSAEQQAGDWVNILVDGGGAVLSPIDSVTKVDAFDFKNRDAEKTFGHLEAAQ